MEQRWELTDLNVTLRVGEFKFSTCIGKCLITIKPSHAKSQKTNKQKKDLDETTALGWPRLHATILMLLEKKINHCHCISLNVSIHHAENLTSIANIPDKQMSYEYFSLSK